MAFVFGILAWQLEPRNGRYQAVQQIFDPNQAYTVARMGELEPSTCSL